MLDGDMASQPAGTVFIACTLPSAPGAAAISEARRHHVTGSRDAMRQQAAQAALDLMRRALVRTGRGAAVKAGA